MIEGEEQEELLNTLAETPQEEVRTIEEDIYVIGVESLNGQAGDLTLKSINGENLVGEGNIALQTPLDQTQLAAVNSGIDSAKVGQIATNATNITTLQNTKQDNLTQTQLNAVNSGIDATKVSQIATNTGNITSNTNRITTIEGKIPSAASSSNKLTDKNYVDNAIATNTANYISDNGQPFQSYADLVAYSGPLTNNDYAFVETVDSAGNDIYTRYKYNADQAQWAEEYTITNPYFTSDQWASINSGIAANDVTQIGTNKTDIAGLQTSKQDKLTTAQQSAVDSGIDATKVQQIATNATDITALQTGKQDKLTAGTNIQINGTTISATDTKYTAGTGLTLTGTQFSVTEPVPSGFFTDTTASQTSVGAGLTINGTSEAPLKNVELKGDTFQQTYSGKNLANYLNTVGATSDTTLTFVAEGFRSVTTSSGFGAKLVVTGLSSSTTYTLSFNLAVASGTASKVVRVFEGTSQSVIYATLNQVPSGASSLTFTTGASATSVNIWFYNGIPGAGDVTWTNIQLEIGSATTYEPYVGGAPSPNPSYPQDINVVTGEQTVTVAGKNLVWTGWAQDFVARVNAANKAKIETVDNKECVYWEASTGYDSYDTKYIFSTQWKENTQYTVSADIKPSSTFSLMCFVYTDGTADNWTTGLTAGQWAHITITSTAGKTIKYICERYNGGDVYLDLSTFQVEEGTTATAYEPQGQTYLINFPAISKNLVDFSTFTPGYVAMDGTVTSSGGTGDMKSGFVRIKPNTDYTFTIVETTGTYAPWIGFNFYTEKVFSSFISPRKVREGAGVTSYTVTSPATANYLIVSARNLSQATKVQLEEGDQSTAWEAYQTLELAKIGTYQDYIYKEGDTWFVHKEAGKAVLDGTEDWADYTTQYAGYYTAYTGSKHWGQTGSALSADMFKADYFQSFSGNIATAEQFLSSTMYATYLKISSNTVASVATLKTWLGNHNTTVYYVLATATNTAITDATFIAQLEALWNAQTYNPQTNIAATTPAPNLPAILTIDVFKNNWNGTLAGYNEQIKRLEARVEDLEA